MQSLPKDLVNHLINDVDDKSILQLIKTSSRFRNLADERFFEELIKRRYPYFVKWKLRNETWKGLFSNMVYYMEKLEKEFGIPYIPTEFFDPRRFYLNNKGKMNIWNQALIYANVYGDINIVKKIITTMREMGETPKLDSSFIAAEKGNLNLLKYLISQGYRGFNYTLSRAAFVGQLEIVKYLVENYNLDITSALDYARRNKNNKEVVEYLESKI